MSTRIFTTNEVSSLTGMSRQKLDYWDRTGLLIPSVRQAQGKGSRRFYSEDDLIYLSFIRQLHYHKWSTQKIRKALTRLRDFMDSSEQVVLINGRDTILALYRNKLGERVLLDTLNSGGQQVLTIVLETLVEETHRVVESFSDKVVVNG